MKRMIIFMMSIVVTCSLSASFEWENVNGKGSFEQVVFKNRKVVIGEIPVSKKDVKINIESYKDVDLQLVDASTNTQIIAWPKGTLSGPKEDETTYEGMNIFYSGYNGKNGKKGHETIEIRGTTTRVLTVKVYGYQKGKALINYEWKVEPSKKLYKELCDSDSECGEDLVCSPFKNIDGTDERRCLKARGTMCGGFAGFICEQHYECLGIDPEVADGTGFCADPCPSIAVPLHGFCPNGELVLRENHSKYKCITDYKCVVTITKNDNFKTIAVKDGDDLVINLERGPVHYCYGGTWLPETLSYDKDQLDFISHKEVVNPDCALGKKGCYSTMDSFVFYVKINLDTNSSINVKMDDAPLGCENENQPKSFFEVRLLDMDLGACKDNYDCEYPKFCKKEFGQCKETGICTEPMFASCPKPNDEITFPKLCTCDGATIDNYCAPDLHTNIAFGGPCEGVGGGELCGGEENVKCQEGLICYKDPQDDDTSHPGTCEKP